MSAGILLMLLKSTWLFVIVGERERHRHGNHSAVNPPGHISLFAWLVLLGIGLLVVWGRILVIGRREGVKWRCKACRGAFRARYGATLLCPHCQAPITLPPRSRGQPPGAAQPR
jgi:hypothetical protein